MSYSLTSGVAVITGGSQGIGAACVRRFVENGWAVATVALPGEDFEDRADGAVEVLSGDLTDEDVRRRLIEGTLERWGRIDALVNNAGVGLYAPASNVDTDRLRRVFDVNFTAALRMAQLVVPTMRRQGAGTIVNIGSVAGEAALPWAAGYGASKAALHAVTDCLRRELRQDGIRVVKVCPGIVATEFRKHALGGVAPSEVLKLRFVVSAEAVAEAVWRGVKSGTGRTIYVPRIGRVFTAMEHLCPWLMDWYLGRLSKPNRVPTRSVGEVGAGGRGGA